MEKIICPYFNGLGDQLQFSTLPRKFNELGFEVYISNKSLLQEDIKLLVWQINPYVKGFTDKEPNAGDLEGVVYNDYGYGFIGNWEKIHGLYPDSLIPEIYYHPKEIPELKDKILVDLNAKSLNNQYSLRIQAYVKDIQNTVDIKKGNVFDYCDQIYSCKKFICLNSGGNSLASAIKKYKYIEVDCLVEHTEILDNMYARKHFFYDNINYVWV